MTGVTDTATVMVFAPAPVLTVTVEQQADTVELHVHPGGQGVWQSRMAASLGCRVTICISVGGEVGDLLEKLLASQDVTVHVVPRQAGSGWYLHDRRQGERIEIAANTGTPMVRHDIDELYNVALVEGLQARVSILSGPSDPSLVAPDVYRRLAADLTGNGGQVLADLSGDHLDAVLRGGVAFLKVSHTELIADRRAADESEAAMVEAGHRLRAEGAGSVVISRADEPALAFFEDHTVRVLGPRLEATDQRGAGDSMTAGVASVLAHGGGLGEAIRTGAAAGALNVTRHGLGTGRAEAVHELLRRVRLEPVEQGQAPAPC
jgi:1-phosphofructokinase